MEDVRRRGTVDSVCPVERALAVVGSRNAMLVMREAAYGTTRFDGFAERTGTSPATTATHLRALTDAGLLARRTYRDPGERSREEYVLTDAGRDLVPVLFGLFEWGSRHAGSTPPPVELVHEGCGEPVAVRVTCADGHDVTPDEVQLRRRAGRPTTGEHR